MNESVKIKKLSKDGQELIDLRLVITHGKFLALKYALSRAGEKSCVAEDLWLAIHREDADFN